MAELRRDFMCCGLAELANISDHNGHCADAIYEALENEVPFAERNPDLQCSHIVFSQAYKKAPRVGYGDRLRVYIEREGLGSVIEAPSRINPNSGNRLTVWVWAIDSKALLSWFRKERKRRSDDDN